MQMVSMKEHFKMFLWPVVMLFLIAENRKKLLQLTFPLPGVHKAVCTFKARFVTSPCFLNSQM